MPEVQKPHWMAPCSTNAACTARSVSPSARPSTVRISRPSASTARWVQALTGAPSTSTVQAPHTWMSHERLAPLRPSCSRRTSRSRLCGMTSTATARPLTVQARLDDDGVGIACLDLLSLSARGGDLERPLHARAGQRALVLGGAVAITHRLHLAGGRSSQLLGPREEDGSWLVGAFALDLEEPLRPRADAADGDPKGPRLACHRDAQGGALVHAELEIGRRRLGRPRTQTHRGQDLVLLAGRLVWSANEVREGDVARASSRPQVKRPVEGQEEGGEIAVWIREGQVTAHRANVADTDVGDVAGDAGHERA